MQSQFNDNDNNGYSIEHCLCFDRPDGDSHILMLSGSCFSRANPDPVTIHVRHEGERIGCIIPDEVGSDLQDQEKKNPLQFGFQNFINVNRRIGTGETVELEINTGGCKTKVERKVTHIHDHVNGYIESRNLDGLKRVKLENLVLNETERIHHVKGVKSTPIRLKIDTGWACNLDCPYCHANLLRKNGFTLRAMSDETFRNLMDRFAGNLIEVCLGCWGEPFLHPGTCGYIRAMKEYGIHVIAESHMSLELSDEEIDDIVTSGLDKLVVSVDGVTQSVYQQYRRGGDLDRVMDNLSRIIERKNELGSTTPAVAWQYLTFDWNTKELEPARMQAKKLGCDDFVVKKGETFEPYTPFLAYRDNSFMDAMSPGNQEKMTRRCEEKRERNEYFGCDLLYNQMVIHSDGAIHPCTYYHAPRLLYGSVHLKKDVFNTAHYKNARRLFIKPPPRECQGYNPCLNCTVVTDEKHQGHVPDDFDFFTAFELLMGEKLDV